MTKPKIRVLVVDDSAVSQRMLSDVINGEADMHVCGVASSGAAALARLAVDLPDLITLDVEMPELDGVETLKRIRKSYPSVPVVMVSSFTERGAQITIQALIAGANEYCTKPSKTSGLEDSRSKIRAELIPKIRQIIFGPSRSHSVLPLPADAPRDRFSTGVAPAMSGGARDNAVGPANASFDGLIDVVAVGVSLGGPAALVELVSALPPKLPVPVLIVQHMPAAFTRALAERLSALGGLSVVEAADQDEITPGKVWIAPGDYHMEVVRTRNGTRLRTHQGPLENSCRPAADVLFRSVADVYGSHALGVVMTGMGYDGLRGAMRMRECGAKIIAQDEATSSAWGMAGAVVRAGLADKVLPLKALGAEIEGRVLRSGRPGMRAKV